MNIRFVIHQLGALLIVLSLLLFLLAGWAELQVRQLGDESERLPVSAFLISGGIGLVLGLTSRIFLRCKDRRMGRREALLLVAASWILGAQLAALPYLFWAHLGANGDTAHPFDSNVNCYFESMSGLTTTGATILDDVASLPRSLLLWRALTQWLGGLGIVVLFVAVLPSVGVGGKRLFRVEAPGPSPDGVRPHIRDTARVLWLIYLGFTGAQILALKWAGLDWFESTCHTFTTVATAGFSTRNGSVGEINSIAVDVIIICFMVLSGVNFGLYYQIMRGKLSSVLKNKELQLYLLLVLGGSVIVSLLLVDQPLVRTTGETLEPSVGEAFRHGVFTTTAIQTTTGFCTADFNRWPFLAQAILILLMFVGGCAGSTSGGIKVIRIWVAFKVMLSQIELAFRPHVVRPVKVGTSAIDPDLKLGTIAYVFGIVVLFTLGSGLIMILEPPESGCSFTTASTASLATLCTIGPGLEKVGAVGNYGWFTNPSKIVMTVLMLLGRLEIFAVVVLFSPRFWQND